MTTPATIDFFGILKYAGRFPEMRMIGSRPIDIETLDRRSDSTDGPINAFGGISPGMTFGDGWRVGGISVRQQEIDLQCEGPQGAATFMLGAPNQGPAWPFDTARARIGYHPSDLDETTLNRVGRDLADMIAGLPEMEGGFSDLVQKALDSRHVSGARPNPAIVERRPDGKVYVRLTTRCQERCVFCFFFDSPAESWLDDAEGLPDEPERSLALLDPKAVTQLIITGGEPTLADRFEDILSGLLERGFDNIVVQTNGIFTAKAGFLDRFKDFRKRVSFGFSLHAADWRTSAAITGGGTEATFQAKLDSIQRAVELGYVTKITCVLTTINLDSLDDMVGFCVGLKQVDPTLENVILQFSMPSVQGLMRSNRDLYPTLTAVADAVGPALDLADAGGLRASFSSLCSVPPCCIPSHLRHLETMWYKKGPTDWWESERAYAAQCAECVLKPWCSGVSPQYLEWFSDHELVPFTASDTTLLMP